MKYLFKDNVRGHADHRLSLREKGRGILVYIGLTTYETESIQLGVWHSGASEAKRSGSYIWPCPPLVL